MTAGVIDSPDWKFHIIQSIVINDGMAESVWYEGRLHKPSKDLWGLKLEGKKPYAYSPCGDIARLHEMELRKWTDGE